VRILTAKPLTVFAKVGLAFLGHAASANRIAAVLPRITVKG
jgi:hypothetical protein